MVEFYLLMIPRFPLRKREHKSCFDNNRTHDYYLRTSRCAGYLLDHSGDSRNRKLTGEFIFGETEHPQFAQGAQFRWDAPWARQEWRESFDET